MSSSPTTQRDALLSFLLAAMREDESIMLLCADFGSPVLDQIRSHFPSRFVNVGIAEQNLINVSTGLALEGRKVFAYAIAPFITMRCYEQIRVNLAILSQIRPMSVTLIGVGAGCSYTISGPTHQCFEDLTIMRGLPNVAFFSPADAATVAALAPGFLAAPGIRYLRLDAKPLPDLPAPIRPDDGYRVVSTGTSGDVLVATGHMAHTAYAAAQALTPNQRPTVLDFFRLAPGIDHPSLPPILANARGVFTLEEGFVGAGGLDALVLQLLNRLGLRPPVIPIGMRPRYHFDLGSRDQLMKPHGADLASVIQAISQPTFPH